MERKEEMRYPDEAYNPVKEFAVAVGFVIVLYVLSPIWAPFYIWQDIRASQAKKKLIERRFYKRRILTVRRKATEDRRKTP